MRKITDEEYKTLRTRPISKKHPVRAWIERMEAGDKLKIERSEFTWLKRSPAYFTNEVRKKTGNIFRVERLMDGTGWVVIREE